MTTTCWTMTITIEGLPNDLGDPAIVLSEMAHADGEEANGVSYSSKQGRVAVRWELESADPPLTHPKLKSLTARVCSRFPQARVTGLHAMEGQRTEVFTATDLADALYEAIRHYEKTEERLRRQGREVQADIYANISSSFDHFGARHLGADWYELRSDCESR